MEKSADYRVNPPPPPRHHPPPLPSYHHPPPQKPEPPHNVQIREGQTGVVAPPPIIQTVRRRPGKRDLSLVVGGVALLLLVVSVPFAMRLHFPDSPAGASGVFSVDRERAAVGKHLKENLPTGKWEEIRWWPAQQVDGTSDWADCRICRMKYRAENGFGGKSVFDQVFIYHEDGRVSIAHEGFHRSANSRFPE